MTTVKVIGAGLAGSEAAWQLAERGISVQLYEMRPKVMSPPIRQETSLNWYAQIHFAAMR